MFHLFNNLVLLRDSYDADVHIGQNCIFANNKEHKFIRENMAILTADTYDDLIKSGNSSYNNDDCSFFKWISQFRNKIFLIVNNKDYDTLFCKWVKFLFPKITKDGAFDLYRISIYNYYCKTFIKCLPKKCYTELKREAFDELFDNVQLTGFKKGLLNEIKDNLSIHFYMIQAMIAKDSEQKAKYAPKFLKIFFNYVKDAYKDVLNKNLQLLNFFENDCKIDSLMKTKMFKQAKLPRFEDVTQKDLNLMRAAIENQAVTRREELIMLNLVDFYFNSTDNLFTEKFIEYCIQAVNQDPEHSSIFWSWGNQEETDITLFSYIYNLYETDVTALEQFKLAE